MLKKKAIIVTLTSLGMLLTTASSVATPPANHVHSSAQIPNHQFSQIDQPLEKKVAVTFTGLAIICLEIWWFLLSNSKSQT
jgi:plastocyanin domain-containing protein